jgi:hypothetical protein
VDNLISLYSTSDLYKNQKGVYLQIGADIDRKFNDRENRGVKKLNQQEIPENEYKGYVNKRCDNKF